MIGVCSRCYSEPINNYKYIDRTIILLCITDSVMLRLTRYLLDTLTQRICEELECSFIKEKMTKSILHKGM